MCNTFAATANIVIVIVIIATTWWEDETRWDVITADSKQTCCGDNDDDDTFPCFHLHRDKVSQMRRLVVQANNRTYINHSMYLFI